MPKAPPEKVDAPPPVLGVKVTLDGFRPPIWRRLAVSRTMTLGRLHDAIQAAMGWTHAHLHAFRVGDRRYGDPGHQSKARPTRTA